MSTSAEVTSKRLEPLPKAVVVDTNLWGPGILDVDRLTNLAELVAKVHVQVWVPTQVILEWASHAQEDIASFAPIGKRLRRAGIAADMPKMPVDIHAVVDELTTRVAAIPNVKVLEMTGDAAVAGLRNQILGTGPGTKKHGIKTGAVDSAFVRDALAKVGNDPSHVVFISGNVKDLAATARDMDVGPLLIRSENSIAGALFFSMAAPAEVQQYIAGEFVGLVSVAPDAPDPHSQMDHPYFNEPWFGISDVEMTDPRLADVVSFDVTEVQLEPAHYSVVGLRSMEIFESEENNPYSGSVDFEALLVGSVGIFGYDLDADGEVQSHNDVLSGVLIEARFTASVVDNQVTFTAIDTASVQDPEIRFDSGEDSWEWLRTFIGSLAGIEVVGESDGWSPGELVLKGANGRESTIERWGNVDEWTVAFDIDDGGDIRIGSLEDPSVRVWAGKDTFDMFPPYQLLGLGDHSGAGPFEAIASLWRYLVEPVSE